MYIALPFNCPLETTAQQLFCSVSISFKPDDESLGPKNVVIDLLQSQSLIFVSNQSSKTE